ncbi:hypothetical protein GGR56DRAFT_505727 [Xylariaceae sp. FL0804]|nr:hypothetical protein GGR56DRAFT_505727 [Xylariaceae sp. FL0804]
MNFSVSSCFPCGWAACSPASEVLGISADDSRISNFADTMHCLESVHLCRYLQAESLFHGTRHKPWTTVYDAWRFDHDSSLTGTEMFYLFLLWTGCEFSSTVMSSKQEYTEKTHKVVRAIRGQFVVSLNKTTGVPWPARTMTTTINQVIPDARSDQTIWRY